MKTLAIYSLLAFSTVAYSQDYNPDMPPEEMSQDAYGMEDQALLEDPAVYAPGEMERQEESPYPVDEERDWNLSEEEIPVEEY